LFRDDKALYEMCTDLSTIIGEHRDVTIMLVTRYLDSVIETKRGASKRRSPSDIHDVIVLYAERIHAAVVNPKYDLPKTIDLCNKVAWECVRKEMRVGNAGTSRPAWARVPWKSSSTWRVLV
jgi:hypothetical protein